MLACDSFLAVKPRIDQSCNFQFCNDQHRLRLIEGNASRSSLATQQQYQLCPLLQSRGLDLLQRRIVPLARLRSGRQYPMTQSRIVTAWPTAILDRRATAGIPSFALVASVPIDRLRLSVAQKERCLPKDRINVRSRSTSTSVLGAKQSCSLSWLQHRRNAWPLHYLVSDRH